VTHATNPFCEGSMPVDGQILCESDADCEDGMRCFFQNSPTSCNLGCAGPIDECGPMSPCQDGFVCSGIPAAEVGGSCTCGGGLQCVVRCETDADCGPTHSCEPDGRCVPRPCTAASDCGTARTCDPTSLASDVHGCRLLGCNEPSGPDCFDNQRCAPAGTTSPNGCVTITCETESDCDCGACSPVLIGGARQCLGRPGQCAFPVF
jgi:hypothetical protein